MWRALQVFKVDDGALCLAAGRADGSVPILVGLRQWPARGPASGGDYSRPGAAPVPDVMGRALPARTWSRPLVLMAAVS